jgi:hypothetical protein
MSEIPLPKKRLRSTPRVVYPPAPFLPPSATLPPNCVVSLVLEAGERVEWTWTTDPNGARYVTGYTISRPRRASGVKMGDHVPQGLQHDFVAPEQLPADAIVHPKLVVTRKSGEVILKQTRTGKPTKALRDLMRAIREASEGRK